MITPQQQSTGHWRMVNHDRNIFRGFNPSSSESIREACRYVGREAQADIVIRQMSERGYRVY